MAALHIPSPSLSVLNHATTPASSSCSSSLSSCSSSSPSGVPHSIASNRNVSMLMPLYVDSQRIAGFERSVCCSRRRSWSRMSVVAAAKAVPSDKTEEVSSVVSNEEELLDYELSLPENVPDFWEGPQWNALGFVIQYLWAFGVLVSLVACGIAVRSYNLGATDFRDTPVFKESVLTQDKLQAAPEIDSDGSTDPLLLDAPPLQES